MRRFILTGAPGSGKTSILRILAGRGYPVIAEAATDVIAAEQARGIGEPWQDPAFIDKIIELQRSRQLGQHSGGQHSGGQHSGGQPSLDQHSGGQPSLDQPGDGTGPVEFYDRSPVCTRALATFLGYQPTAALRSELTRIIEQSVYQRLVFFIRSIGFIEPTSARRISYDESLRFEQIHEAIYARLNFRLIDVNPGTPEARADFICDRLSRRFD